MNCTKCKTSMVKVDRWNEMADMDDDMSDGQLGDYLASEESGDNGAWNIAIVEYKCHKCNVVIQAISDDLKSYDPLIKAWHEKAISGDYFSRFVFEYLAFIAHVKNNLFFQARSDRKAIQSLKQVDYLQDEYLALIKEDQELSDVWKRIIEELKKQALYNSSIDQDNPEIDKWWNSNGNEPDINNKLERGCVFSLDDWDNMVEFWCAVRNNLFHGGKNPNIKRDIFLVEHAYKTLSKFVELQVNKM